MPLHKARIRAIVRASKGREMALVIGIIIGAIIGAGLVLWGLVGAARNAIANALNW